MTRRRLWVLGVLAAALVVIGGLALRSSLVSRSDNPELTLAVAANFTRAMEALVAAFEDETNQAVTLVFGSTGTLYAQITNGAPYDAFFAADARRPRLLDEDGATVAGTRFTYAIGRPVLWSPDSDLVQDAQVLVNGGVRRVALADPKLAPYGEAARQVMTGLGVWETLQPKIVYGENVNQAYQFVDSGNAEVGFVALSQVIDPKTGNIGGSRWQPPPTMYDPIEQQAVILKRTDERPLAERFMTYLRSDSATEVIRRFGYAVPNSETSSTD